MISCLLDHMTCTHPEHPPDSGSGEQTILDIVVINDDPVAIGDAHLHNTEGGNPVVMEMEINQVHERNIM